MNYLIENWFLIVGAIVVLIVLVLGLINIFKTPSNKQLEMIKEWLLFAIVEAEKELGSGTGKLKLSLVYGSFISKFKWLSTIVSFETFSRLVDESLETLREMLETNKEVKKLVEGKETERND